jgi:sugar phosphate isomerase/epimerase
MSQAMQTPHTPDTSQGPAGRITPTLHGSQLRGAKLTLEEKAALAQRFGYPALDFSLAEAGAYPGGPAAVRELLARHGLQGSVVGGVFGVRLTDATEGEFEDALRGVTEAAHDAAAFGGIRTGTVLPGRADVAKEELWPVVVRRLQQLDGALEGTGIRLGVEFIGVKTLRLEKPHAFVQSMAEALRLLNDARVRNIGLTLDSYHWYAGEDTLDTIRGAPAERIAILHVNDAKALPPDQLIDQDRVLPGEGTIPLADWLRAIANTGFSGPIAMEVLGPRLAGASPEDCARMGQEAVAGVFTAAGLADPFRR